MFWYVLLMFGTLSFYNFKNKKDMIIIFLIISVSYFALFAGYSRSARLAFVVGLAIYIGLSLFNVRKKYLHIVIWVLTLYIVFSPILFSFVDLTPYHQRLIQRDAIYHTAAALIKEHWLFGYGFGSTFHMYIKDFVDIAELPKHYIDRFPGGHPHNLSLLFWLEFGVFGAVFLAYYIHKLLLVFIDKTYNKISQPALFGMIVAFDIITSFSWSILIYQVLLTFSFFGIMLVLSMNINIQRNEGSQ
jgi:O-antigen ligase